MQKNQPNIYKKDEIKNILYRLFVELENGKIA
jgi:hypothetical protein